MCDLALGQAAQSQPELDELGVSLYGSPSYVDIPVELRTSVAPCKGN